jgi:hypothetical protein
VGIRSSPAPSPAWASGSSVLWHYCWGSQACWLAPCTREAAGALGPAFTVAPVSLVFQDESSRSCIKGESRAPSFCVCQEVGLMILQLQSDFKGGRSGVLGCESFFLWLVFLYLWIWRGLCFSLYGTPCVPFRGPLIFLFWGSWLPLGCRNVNNLPSCPLHIFLIK